MEQIREQVLSPKVTADGMLKKCWQRTPKGVELVKGAGDDDMCHFATAREPLCEYYSQQVAQILMFFDALIDNSDRH
ncbi:hypothetical protein [Helicobacter labacensis]|uniref:hypothetical protein n=1 Tax=Helicobacter labacensis TaxID=2316079 RepID=UPI0013CE123C|nr:hypothetical protein [Helicobacter labacensis]